MTSRHRLPVVRSHHCFHAVDEIVLLVAVAREMDAHTLEKLDSRRYWLPACLEHALLIVILFIGVKVSIHFTDAFFDDATSFADAKREGSTLEDKP